MKETLTVRTVSVALLLTSDVSMPYARFMTALEKAIQVLGTAAELARRLGIQPAAVYQWKRVPGTRCKK